MLKSRLLNYELQKALIWRYQLKNSLRQLATVKNLKNIDQNLFCLIRGKMERKNYVQGNRVAETAEFT